MGVQIFPFGVVKSIQKGTVAVNIAGVATTNITVSSVNTSKSSVSFKTMISTTGGGDTWNAIRIELTSSTNVAITTAGGFSATATLAWELIEYY